jgi:hypothetical protein
MMVNLGFLLISGAKFLELEKLMHDLEPELPERGGDGGGHVKFVQASHRSQRREAVQQGERAVKKWFH